MLGLLVRAEADRKDDEVEVTRRGMAQLISNGHDRCND